MSFLDTNIFAKIISREIPADIVYENERVMAFKDINPKAKVHIIIIPKAEIVTAKEVDENNLSLFGELFLVARYVAEQNNLMGYKLHMNVDEEGGQVVPHAHLHLLSPDYKSDL